MVKIRSLLIGGAVGVVAAYFLDPEQGVARRARVLGQVEGLAQEVQDRVQAALERLDAPMVPRPEDDLSLLGRVERALLGLPDVERGAVETEVIDGQVVLRGEVTSEAQERQIVETAGQVPGVAGVESQLEIAD